MYKSNDRIMSFDNWHKMDFKNPTHRKKIMGAVGYYLMKPHNQAKKIGDKIRGKIQEFTTTGDFPQTNLIEVIKSFQLETPYDNGYEQIFTVKDYTGSRASGYDIMDVVGGVTFRLIQNGEKVDIYTMSGTKVRVYFNYYGGGLGWHQQLFDDQEYIIMEDQAREMRNKAYSTRAAAYYAMIEALFAAGGAGHTTAWQQGVDTLAVGTAGYAAQRDVATINLACQTIFQNCDGKGYSLGNPMDTGFILLHPLELSQRINNALNYHLQHFPTSPNQNVYRWRPIATNMLVDRTHYYVIFPGEKMIAAYRMDLKFFQDFDITSLLHTMTGWMRYGGSIGDPEQIERCAIA